MSAEFQAKNAVGLAVVFRGRVIGLERRFRLKSQFHFDALDQFLDLTIFAVLGALLLVCRLVCHPHCLPQAGAA